MQVPRFIQPGRIKPDTHKKLEKTIFLQKYLFIVINKYQNLPEEHISVRITKLVI